MYIKYYDKEMGVNKITVKEGQADYLRPLFVSDDDEVTFIFDYILIIKNIEI